MTINTINEVAKALEVIKNVCKNNNNCEDCIFYNKDFDIDSNKRICMLSKTTPNAWIICNDIKWRALL